MPRTFKSLGAELSRIISEKKGENIAFLDVRRSSPITEYMLIATVLSSPHLEALEHEVRKTAHAFRFPCLRRARPASSQWRILDFGGLLVHLMTEDSRRFYSLDKLYHEAKPVSWQAEHAPKRPAPKRVPRRKNDVQAG